MTKLTLTEPQAYTYMPDGIATALEEGCQSVVRPYCHGVCWPLCIARTYHAGPEVLTKRKSWEDRIDWLELSAERETWSAAFTADMHAVLTHCPYDAGLPGLQHGSASSAATFGELFGDGWLSYYTLNCMFDVIRFDYKQSGHDTAVDEIARAYLGQAIAQYTPRSTTAQWWGVKLAWKTVPRVFFPMNVNGAH